MENFFKAIFAIFLIITSVIWISGVFKILSSNNIRLTKLIYLIFSCIFPPFPIIYLFKKPIVKEIKNAPEKIADTVVSTAKTTGKIIGATTDFLLKK